MTKEKFVEIMTRFKLYKEVQDEISEAVKKLSPDFNYFFDEMGECLILDALKAATNDIFDEIIYYVYETEFGTNDCADCVWDENNNRIPFKTFEDLYDLIQLDNKMQKKEED